MSVPRPAAKPRLLAMYAHPDDEAFGAGGSFALLIERGVAITLICATRGEVGEISDPALASAENLAAVRESELRAAMRFVGVDDIRFLDYRDSGMAGTAENDDPRAFVRQDEGMVAGRLLAVIRELRPDAIVTFGPDGVYGHPDHLMIHRTATAAAILAGGAVDGPRPAIYFNAVPRERIQRMAERPSGPFASMTPEEISRLGTTDEKITTRVDVASMYDRKWQALLAHRTQMGETGPFAEMPEADVRAMMSTERFTRFDPPYEVDDACMLLDQFASSE